MAEELEVPDISDLDYRVFSRLSGTEEYTEDLAIDLDMSNAHLRRILSEHILSGCVALVGKQRRTTRGRPMNIYGLTELGDAAIYKYERHLNSLRNRT